MGWDLLNSSSFISFFIQTNCVWTYLWVLWYGLPDTHSRLWPMQNARFILRSSSFSLRRGKRTTMAMLNKKALHIGIKQLCWYLCITPQASLSHRKLHNSCRQPHYAVVNVSTQGEPHAAGPVRSWDKSITSGLTPSGVGSKPVGLNRYSPSLWWK